MTSAAALRATSPPSNDDAESSNVSHPNNAPASQLTVKLSRSTRHRVKGSQEGAIIPLVGVGVGNSPHHNIPGSNVEEDYNRVFPAKREDPDKTTDKEKEDDDDVLEVGEDGVDISS